MTARRSFAGSPGPFFSDIEMEIVQLVAEGDTVAARFRCSGTHIGAWLGRPPSGRRFARIDEVSFFTITDERITKARGLEDTLRRKSSSACCRPRSEPHGMQPCARP